MFSFPASHSPLVTTSLFSVSVSLVYLVVLYSLKKRKWKSLSCVWLCNPGLYSPWNSPHQNTGVGSLSLLQEIIPTQGSNAGLWHCRRILYPLSHKRSPRILEWVAYSFSSGSSQSRNWTGVSCIVGGFSTNWAIREAHIFISLFYWFFWFHI